MPHSITIQVPEKAWEVYCFSQGANCPNEFAVAFARMLFLMAGYAKDAEAKDGFLKGTVWGDWAPHSFNWHAELVDKDGNSFKPPRTFMSGGLVHHGPADDGSGGMPTLSVLLGPRKSPHEWCIHT